MANLKLSKPLCRNLESAGVANRVSRRAARISGMPELGFIISISISQKPIPQRCSMKEGFQEQIHLGNIGFCSCLLEIYSTREHIKGIEVP